MDGARINSFCQLPFLISCISYFSTRLYGEPLFTLKLPFRSAIPLCQNAKIISLPKCQKSLVLYFKRQRNRAYNQPLSLLVVGPIFQFRVSILTIYPFFRTNYLLSVALGFFIAAWAAASRAIGTRKGEQDT